MIQIELFLKYLSSVKRYSENTIIAYKADLYQFYEFCGLERNNEDFSRVTTKLVREWGVAEMRGDLRVNGARGKLSAASGKRKLSSIKAFFRFLVKEKVIEVNPAENISGPKLPKRLPVFVREEEMECTLDDAEKKKGFSGLRDFLILLKCTSAYPAPYEDINLKTIPSMKEVFDCVVGLSDHTMGCAVAGAGVALGAKVVEKHLTLRRADGGADAAFSMEPEEFKEMVDHIRMIEKAVGKVTYDLTPKQKKSREHSRSLFVAQDMKAGDVFTPENLRSVRPSCGLHTRYYEELLGKRITRDARLGTPMDWSLVDFTEKEQQ